ncbi:MAG: helicase domain protein [Fibrobacteria bacterium]|jgi:ATP-dependent helicase HepA|nr:helicase domain protein [Fibrobacteria bacterium]
MSKFIPGQRWVSDSEPELGLGVVLEAGFRDVKVHFPAADETRLYMQRSAPLRRARLGKGDRARGRAGEMFVIQAVEEQAGLLTYRGGGHVLPEGDLLDRLSFSDPDKRLLAGQVSKPRTFSLRLRTLELQRDMLGSPVRGLAGARMELLPHQIGIAHEVASRHNPRVLLADEVGLGKTIEAGLIFHRLHATGQINRVVVVAPSQLVHQWMVELYRRFHHLFTVLDEETCRAEEKGDATKNPFAQRPLILCPLDLFEGNGSSAGSGARRVEQAAAAGIDLLIVDEAHHLQWSPEKVSPAYAAMEKLARVARGVLLLTATPIQLGQAGHFGRLRLLDPGRFADFGAYLEETRHYEALARWADALLTSEVPSAEAAAGLRAAFPRDAALHARLEEYLAGAAGAREKLVEDLIDRHGTGRLMFRNRRQAMGGFPGRVLHPVPLEAPPEHAEFAKAAGWAGDAAGVTSALPPHETSLAKYLSGAPAYTASDFPGHADAGELPARAWRRDARLAWLADFLKEHPGEKVLLLCAHKSVVFALQDILPTLTTAPFTSFHENLTMTTRDKNAAWFAQADGAQVLISSEIGSEGRNFQFARHLVLFDLPLDPSVLEQRIGRLDRIGRKGDVQIHVPYLRGTAQETVFRWYHEGFDAFRRTVLGSDTFHELLIGKVLEAARSGDEASVTALIALTRDTSARVRETLEKGRDRLLEINSSRAGLANGLIAAIQKADGDPSLETYLEEVFDHFGLESQKTAVKRGYLVVPAERMLLDSFPGIPEEGLVLTYDRGEALAREEIAFLSIDHPLARTAVDLMLEGEEGTAGFVEWRGAPRQEGRKSGGVALEAVFVLSATAPGTLHLDRFLPPTPIRVLVDQEGDSLGHLLKDLDAAELDMAPTGLLEEHHEHFEPLLPKLLDAAQEHAAFKMSMLKKEAHQEAEARLLSEFDRLCTLRAVNPLVSESEVRLAEARAERVLGAIAQAELRLDSVRLILMGKTGL